MTTTTAEKKTKKGFSGRLTVLVGFAIIGLVAIPFLLAGPGAERYVDLRSLRQLETSSWRVGSFHMTEREVREIDQWPLEDIHTHIMRSGLGSPLRPTPSQYWDDLGVSEEERPPLWHSTFRLLPMAIIVRIENRRPMTPEARTQLDLRLIMASLLDPSDPEEREAYLRLDERLAEGVRVFDPLDPPRGRVGYVSPTEGERLAREILDQILDAAHRDRVGAPTAARQILLSAASVDPAPVDAAE